MQTNKVSVISDFRITSCIKDLAFIQMYEYFPLAKHSRVTYVLSF